jgi:hypothetical protein
MKRITFYRWVFIIGLVLPCIELIAIPFRRPIELGNADAFSLLLVAIGFLGLVAVDILEHAAQRRQEPPELPPAPPLR